MTKVPCPIEGCTERKSKRGLHGHIEHGHNIRHERALKLADQAKREAERADARSSRAEGVDALEGADVDGDELDRAIEQLVRRREQRERIRTVQELSDHGEADRSGDRSPIQDVDEVAGLLETLEDLRGQGPEPIGLEDVREVVREEADRTPAADGGPALDWRAQAIRQDLDPEQIEKIAEAQSTGNLGDSIERVVDKLLAAEPESLATFFQIGREMFAGRRRRRPEREPREPRERRADRAGDRVERREPREPADRGDPAEGESEPKSSGRRALESIQEPADDAEPAEPDVDGGADVEGGEGP